MAKGYVFKKGRSWHLRYWHNGNENGQIVRRQKCEWLAPYGDRYRTKRDLAELVAEKLSSVKEADKCPRSSDSFVDYVEEVYLPFVLRDKKASTYSGYKTYFERYIKPRAGKYAEQRHLRQDSLDPFRHLHLCHRQGAFFSEKRFRQSRASRTHSRIRRGAGQARSRKARRSEGPSRGVQGCASRARRRRDHVHVGHKSGRGSWLALGGLGSAEGANQNSAFRLAYGRRQYEDSTARALRRREWGTARGAFGALEDARFSSWRIHPCGTPWQAGKSRQYGQAQHPAPA